MHETIRNSGEFTAVELPAPSTHIGSLNEKPLHAALKAWYAGSNGEFEASIDGFVIDIVQDGLLIEIQTGNFASIKRKLFTLTAQHRVRLIHPIAQEKWIVKLPKGRKGISSRRKSPKRGRLDEIFLQLVSFPKLLANPNFSLMAALIQEEEVRRYDAKRGWRRKGWITEERRLLDVVDHQLFETPEDIAAFLPAELPAQFTTADLAAALGRPRWLAQKMAYCLRQMDIITQVGIHQRAILYERMANPSQPAD